MTVRSERLSLGYDEDFDRRIEWSFAAAGNIVAFDPTLDEGPVIGGQLVRFSPDPTRTSQKRVVDPEFGPALELIVIGICKDRPDLALERSTCVLLPDKFPDVALFQTAYRNLGKNRVRLDQVYSQRILLDRRLAEPRRPSYDLASFQGGAYRWGAEYAVIRLDPGFKQSNFQGVDDIRGVEGVGGGMPFVDVWGPTMGVAVCHLEKVPQWLSLPVEVRPKGRVEVAVVERPESKFGQREWLTPGETFQTVLTALIFHRLDFFDPLRVYGRLLRCRGVAIPEKSPDCAYEPYFKTWGWRRDFTIQKIRDVLPELRSFGIRVANLDDGWFDFMGDWNVNRSPGKFADGESDMIALVQYLHDQGFRSSLWWYPLGVDPKSRLAADHKDLLVQDEDGEYPLDVNRLYQLCPAHAPALAQIRAILTRAVAKWGFDGMYTDFQGLSAVPPCYNKAHGHGSPLDSFQSVPKLFETIQTTLRSLKKEGLHEVCICALPHSPYNMPYYDVASASDPVNAWQLRSRVKVEKAIRGGSFAVGDCYQVPIREWEGFSVPESFESAMGTGAQLTTFYSRLEERERDWWARWFLEYRELQLYRGDYLNLYDLAFDKPEVHVVRKGTDMYYGIFSDVWPRSKRLELRGLDKETSYQVYDYANGRDLGTISGSQPVLNVGFKDSLLLRVRPVPESQKKGNNHE
ncbi:MAG: alpha-galactosidase [Acidobacteriota bacterium]